LSHVSQEFQSNLQLRSLSGFASDHNGEELGPELALFFWRKVFVHECLFEAIRVTTYRTDLVPTKERETRHNTMSAKRNWANAESENPTLVPITA
jgi:hypothetical protein